MKNLLILSFIALSVFSFAGCGTSEYLSALSSVQVDSLKQINDEDIQKALEANPQITLPTTLAIYNASRDKYPFQDSLLTLTQIERAIEISPSLLNPDSYYRSQYNSYRGYYQAPKPINLKQLRLYAAQAKTDLVLFISTSSNFYQDANILSPLYVGLVTIPFVPGQRVELTTYLEAYIIDVRNGLLYSSYRDKRVLKKRFTRVTFSNKIDHHKTLQVQSMTPDFKRFVEETLTNPALQLSINSGSSL